MKVNFTQEEKFAFEKMFRDAGIKEVELLEVHINKEHEEKHIKSGEINDIKSIE